MEVGVGTGGANPRRSGEGAVGLIPGRVAIDYFDPPANLQRYVTTLFHFRCDEPAIQDIQPADVGKILLVLKGRGVADIDGHADFPIPPFSLQSPTSMAVPFRFTEGFHSLGAALTPLGWAALTGLPADEHGNRIFSIEELLRDEAPLESLRQRYVAGAIEQAAMVEELCAFIAAHVKKVVARHAQLVESVVHWLGTSLDPELEALYAVSSYSRRQTQRLVERYFGLNPRALKRKYRAVRAAAILTSPETTDEQVTAVQEYFYDQSHLIREIGVFVGRTPSRLGGGDNPILNKLLDTRNFRIVDAGGVDFDPSI
ncbi:helix-turn-helix domain-containing protein [Erythrobacter sp. SDW2]|uniref:AraC family transcriptional regulator n=1 Tax=Erythrobacter sp. SDW2 TaxID=2907154 RepID=UPI001F45279B|nr:helix-turn-helix domain-containing protein [Erythrobacter sp. SDW2]UIP07269.1 helix-turn-helix domain-containing protein [Erythrobacter sp. SDW2]